MKLVSKAASLMPSSVSGLNHWYDLPMTLIDDEANVNYFDSRDAVSKALAPSAGMPVSALGCRQAGRTLTTQQGLLARRREPTSLISRASGSIGLLFTARRKRAYSEIAQAAPIGDSPQGGSIRVAPVCVNNPDILR
jgi:hypothetical protein